MKYIQNFVTHFINKIYISSIKNIFHQNFRLGYINNTMGLKQTNSYADPLKI